MFWDDRVGDSIWDYNVETWFETMKIKTQYWDYEDMTYTVRELFKWNI